VIRHSEALIRTSNIPSNHGSSFFAQWSYEREKTLSVARFRHIAYSVEGKGRTGVEHDRNAVDTRNAPNIIRPCNSASNGCSLILVIDALPSEVCRTTLGHL